jgi:Xaa-Pro aminopeptidase
VCPQHPQRKAQGSDHESLALMKFPTPIRSRIGLLRFIIAATTPKSIKIETELAQMRQGANPDSKALGQAMELGLTRCDWVRLGWGEKLKS